MHFEWAKYIYQWGDHKILKTEDNILYRKGSKGWAGTNTQYMLCASSSCPGSGMYKTDQDGSSKIIRTHNHDARLYGFEAKAGGYERRCQREPGLDD